MTSKRSSTNWDKTIGARLRRARIAKNMTQEKLGQEVGYTFQQIQKYENGVNRVSTEVLVKLCVVLDQPLSYFIDAAMSSTPDQVEIDQVLCTPEGRDLVQAVRGFSRQNLKSLRDVALAMRGAGA